MAKDTRRDLTTLEYIVLGLISVEPQSGYSIIQYLAPSSASGWNASPGSIYPILKRLEEHGMITGTIEAEHDLRPRKSYTLTRAGAQKLDTWLRQVPEMLPLYEQRELGMWRFQFMEGRLSIEETVQWIDTYLDKIRIFDYGRQQFTTRTLAEMNNSEQVSVHKQLILEVALMEMNTLRTWLELARARLIGLARATGEFKRTE